MLKRKLAKPPQFVREDRVNDLNMDNKGGVASEWVGPPSAWAGTTEVRLAVRAPSSQHPAQRHRTGGRAARGSLHTFCKPFC